MKVYIIDIDGTICTEYYLKDGSKDYKKAKPIKERVAKINNLFLFEKYLEIHLLPFFFLNHSTKYQCHPIFY